MNPLVRLAWRESRTARRRLALYMSSISLGVAALVAIDSFAANVQDSIREQSRALLGGDVQFTARSAFPAPVDSLLDSLRTAGLPLARVTTFGSMASVPRTEGTRLAQVRAVTPGFPLYGDVLTRPQGQWARLHDGRHALVDPSLLIALDARVGDTLVLGYGRFIITGALESIPGDPGVASAIGPRVFIPERYVPETQLLGFGARAEYEAVVRLDGAAALPLPQFETRFRRRVEDAQVRMRTVTQNELNLTEAVGQLADFLAIVGLIALLLGGIGVASGVHAFVVRKVDTVAVLRCLGASGAQVLGIYVSQAALMGVVGSAIGVALGVGIQFLMPRVLGDFLPVDVAVSIDPPAILLGLGIGLWVALVFALRPLLALRRISPLQALRRDDAALASARRADLATYVVDVALVLSVVGLAVMRAGSVRQGFVFAAGIGVALATLAAAAWVLVRLARRLARGQWSYPVRQGVANLHRPANQTRAVVLALGFGAFLVTTLYIVQANLLHRFEVTTGAARGNLIFFDVQDDQRVGLDSLVRGGGHQVISSSPIVTMKVAAVNGRSMDRHAAANGMRKDHWTIRREYRSTYRDTVVTTEKVTKGRWFGDAAPGTDAAGTPVWQLSLEQDLIQELRLSLGDTVDWDVQGVTVRTRLTSAREVNWGRFEPNFFAVFQPGAIAKAPQQHVLVAAVASDTAVARLQRAAVARFPNVSSIDISLIRRTIGTIVEKVSLAVRFLAVFSLAMGIPVLFSAVAATRRDRLREGVLLKTLGATQRQIARVLLSEYAALGLLGASTGLLLSYGGAWALVRFVFELDFAAPVLPPLLIALAMMALAVIIGLLTSREVFRETPAAALREG